MDNNPLISVIMSLHNVEKDIDKSIQSIINQNYQNWELIIIDDASNDKTFEIVKRYSEEDKRISVFQNKLNRGIPYSLNKAINLSRGDYIARMDGDDISYNYRFEEQIKFMISNQDIDVLGSGALVNNLTRGISKNIFMPMSHQEIVKNLFKTSPFIHPSIMAKRSFYKMNNGYNEKYKNSEDYELWFRGSKNSKYHNMKKILIEYSFNERLIYKRLLGSIKIRFKNANSFQDFLLTIKYSIIQSIQSLRFFYF